ncbi:MAG TPA: cupin domain-containing protein [Gammaproteobacteria bacterium]|nr:cupin domain-containing protein [Gammaproteobacteria bacterium]
MNKKILLLTPNKMVSWGDPQVLAKGAKDIILYGNPGKAENYLFRFKLPKHFEIKPFILSSICFLTVIEGDILIGEGDKFEKNLMTILPAQSFCCIPENYPIYFMSSEQTILQFHGIGPVDMKYVNSTDDPRNI